VEVDIKGKEEVFIENMIQEYLFKRIEGACGVRGGGGKVCKPLNSVLQTKKKGERKGNGGGCSAGGGVGLITCGPTRVKIVLHMCKVRVRRKKGEDGPGVFTIRGKGGKGQLLIKWRYGG